MMIGECLLVVFVRDGVIGNDDDDDVIGII